jgi:NAD(P)-dependent dehydrogenase (short-subunit alcohol dehydrogenase family)
MTRTVLITGAAGRLGSEIAKFFASRNDALILIDFEKNKLKGLKSELESHFANSRIDYFVSNFATYGEIEKCTKMISDKFKIIDIIINNASITGDSKLKGFQGSIDQASQTSETFNQVFAVGALSTFIMIRDLHQLMKKSSVASIINVSSIYGIVGITTEIYQNKNQQPPAAYSAVKGAVVSLTKYFATTLPSHIRVNCIAPGGISRNQTLAFKKKYTRKVPMKRMATEKDVVGAIEWLASPNSGYVNGQIIAVDGGWTIK